MLVHNVLHQSLDVLLADKIDQLQDTCSHSLCPVSLETQWTCSLCAINIMTLLAQNLSQLLQFSLTGNIDNILLHKQRALRHTECQFRV